jgi:protease II
MSLGFYRYRPLLRLPIWSLFRRSRSCQYDHHNDLRSVKSLTIQNAERKKFEKFQHENRQKIKRAAISIGRNSEMEDTLVTAMDTCGPYEYYGNTADSEHERGRAVYRRLRSDDKDHVQAESLVLDIDQLRREIPNMGDMSRMKPSMDHTMVALIVELGEDEMGSSAPSSATAALYVKDIERNLICKIDVREVLRSDAYVSVQDPALCPSIVDFEWAVDTRGHALLYLVLDDGLYRPSLVVALDIGEHSARLFDYGTRYEASSAVLLGDFLPSKDDFMYVLREADIAFNVDVGRSKDDKFVVISSHSKVSSEVSIIPIPVALQAAGNRTSSAGPPVRPLDRPLILRARQRRVKYYVDHSGSFFYVATNRPNSCVSGAQDATTRTSASPSPPLLELDMSSDLSIIRCSSEMAIQCAMQNKTSFMNWQPVYPSKSQDSDLIDGALESCTVVSDFDIFKDKIVVYGRRNGFPSVRVLDLAGQLNGEKPSDRIPFVDLTHQIRWEVGSEMFGIIVGMNAFDSSVATFSVSNPIVPGSTPPPPPPLPCPLLL